ncbi:Polynucleotide adenylyltransferase [Bertholletia excelsa]
MTGGGGDHRQVQYPPENGGEFLLQLLRRQPPSAASATASSPGPAVAQDLYDPAVAAVGPTLSLPPFPNGQGLPYYQPPWAQSPPFATHNYFPQGFPLNPGPNPNPNSNPHPSLYSSSPPLGEVNRGQQQSIQLNRQSLGDDVRKLGVLGSNPRVDSVHLHEQRLMFGSLPCEIRNDECVTVGSTHKMSASPGKIDGLLSKEIGIGEVSRRLNGLEVNFQNSLNFVQNMQANSHGVQIHEQERRSSGNQGLGVYQHGGNFRKGAVALEARQPPPGFSSKPSNLRNWDSVNGSFDHNVGKERRSFGEFSHRGFASNHEDERKKGLLVEHGKSHGEIMAEPRLSSQLDYSDPPAGSNLHSVSATDFEDSLLELHGKVGGANEEALRNRLQDQRRRSNGPVQNELDDLDEQAVVSLVLEDGTDRSEKKQHKNSRDKDHRSDTRGQRILGQRMRNLRRLTRIRNDIDRFNAPLLAIYESLIPPEEEKVKQKQLLMLLEKLVSKEWPEARLYLYGSCANSFGVSKSDIDVCLEIEDPDVNKSEVLLKLADILQSDNLQDVQALVRARVPIVKLKDPATGISCDICINNVLAVVNTKLLRDYAQIDVRLRQLAFIIKHWAKSRGVNETYQGTLSSYAYVLMCIHFLQQQRPAILPCLQEMERTYSVTIDNVECAYFDQVDKLSGFGSHNRESIAQLVWSFFNYWAYCHDYATDVISVRTGSILRKQAKDWTRRIGNDRHLICIEDPFEISHDLGRVVDKYSIRVLREEFERAAEIMQHDPNPCVALFEPYIPAG